MVPNSKGDKKFLLKNKNKNPPFQGGWGQGFEP